MIMNIELKDLVLPAAGCFGSVLVWSVRTILSSMASDFRELTDSVKRLNINVAVIVAKVETHEKRIEHLEQRQML